MARRSLLFNKKRSSKAPLSKKRKADRQLLQPCSGKRTRQTHVQEDEEEIEDFIVVDTGSLYEPEKRSQSFVANEKEEAIRTSHLSNTPKPALEYNEVIAEIKPTLSGIDSDVAQQTKDDSLALDFPSIEASEGERSRRQSLELKDKHILSDRRDDHIPVSPLPTTNEDSMRNQSASPEPILDKLDSSISSPVSVSARHNALSTLVSDEDEAQSEYQTSYRPFHPPSDSPKPPAVNLPAAQLSPTNSNTTPVAQKAEPVPVETLEPKRMDNAPLRVLVTKGDQCPAKFMVSGTAINSEAFQQTPPEVGPQARNKISWIETVTESRPNTTPEYSESQMSGLSTCHTHGLGISEVLQAEPVSPHRVSKQTVDDLEPSTSIHGSGALNSPLRSNKGCKTGSSNVHHALNDSHGQSLPERQRETHIGVPNNEVVTGRKGDRRKLPLLVQYPKKLPEAPAISGPNSQAESTNIDTCVWATKVSCLDIAPSLPMVDPNSSLPSPNQSPPLLRFTFDNRAESPLSEAEVQRLVEKFVKDAVALIPSEHSAQPKSYPAGIIMWQSLHRFYKWYAKEEKKQKGTSHEITVMKFELLDVHCQPERVFLLSRKSNLDEFRALKQCIWDLFWVSTNSNDASSAFRILITRAPEMVNTTDFGRLTAAKSTIPSQTTSVFSPLPPSRSDFENAVFAINSRGFERESAHHQPQLPPACPPQLLPTSPSVTIDVEDPKVPQFSWDFVQKSYVPATARRPQSMNTSPTRSGNHESSDLQADPPHQSLIRPDKKFTAVPQPPTASPTVLPPSLNNNLGSQYHLPPPVPSATGNHFSPSSGSHLFPYQNNQTHTTIQLPSPRPSPVITYPKRTETSHSNLAPARNNYAANTARPLFAMPPPKEPAVNRTLLPSTQPTRFTNIAQPVRDPPAPPNPPKPNKDKDMQTEMAPPVPQISRAHVEMKRFRDQALKMISRRQDLVLEDTETTGGRKRTFPDISGVIVDKNSAMGLVVITERGYTVQQVDTGQDGYVDQYIELTLSDGQACVIHGSSTVLYYKRRPGGKAHERRSQSPRIALPSQALEPSQLYMAEDAQRDSLNHPTLPESAAEIKIRVQVDAQGHFSTPYSFSVMQISDNVEFFFAWYSKRTGHGDKIGPRRLRFTLKDAVPNAKVYELLRGNTKAFQRIRGEVLGESEKAKAFMPDLKEFTILVVDPQWMEGTGDETWCDIVPKIS